VVNEQERKKYGKKQFSHVFPEKKKMTLLSLFAALLVALVTSQQTLILTQHTALMALYAALGLPEREKKNFFFFFFWKNSPSFFPCFFPFPGCNTTVCPRFASNQACTGSGLTCAGGFVTSL
jgi:hypothetical protein